MSFHPCDSFQRKTHPLKMTRVITFATGFVPDWTSCFAVERVGPTQVASGRGSGTLDLRRFGRNCDFVS